MKEDTYETIIKRICSLAIKEQLRGFLMSSENCVPIEDAIKEAEEKWPE